MKLLEDLKIWYKEKERIYMKNQKKTNKRHHDVDVKEFSSNVSQIVTRVKSFGSVIHNEFLSEKQVLFYFFFSNILQTLSFRYEREIRRIVREASSKTISERIIRHKRSSVSDETHTRFSDGGVVLRVESTREKKKNDSKDDDEKTKEDEEENKEVEVDDSISSFASVDSVGDTSERMEEGKKS